MHTLRIWSRRHLLIGALALSLLFMQGLGQLHALLHAGLAQDTAIGSLAAADTGTGTGVDSHASPAVDPDSGADSRLFDAHHSCAAFNALTLAFALAVCGLAALLLARSRAPTQARRVLRRHIAPIRRFLSRAPPSFLIA
jgi:hypothetical protein